MNWMDMYVISGLYDDERELIIFSKRAVQGRLVLCLVASKFCVAPDYVE